MLIGFIKHNRALSIVILPIALIILWIYGFLNPVVPLTEHSAPLYRLLISGIGQYPFLITLTSFILIFCEALLLNYIVEKNEIIESNTYLPALAYVILMSLQPEMFSLHPIIIANLFILLALHKLMQTYRKETAYSEAFDTGFFISLACLFYIPSFVFILLLWIGLIIIRPFVWREWAISLLGLSVPWIYLIFAYFWKEKMDMLQYEALYQTLIVPGKSFSTVSLSYPNYLQIAVLLVAAFFTAGRFSGDFSKGTVRSRSNLLLLLYFFILSIVSLFLAPEYSIAYLSFLSIPFSILFSSYLLLAKKEWLAELIFILLIVSVFVNQFFA